MKNTAEKRDVLIIENHGLTRFGLKAALEAQNYFNKILEAENGIKGLKLSQKFIPVLVIMDLHLPDMNGIELIRQIKKTSKNAKIIVLSICNDEELLLEAMSVGARAFCLKKPNIEKLSNIIETVLNGSIWFDPAVSANILNILAREQENRKNSGRNEKEKIRLTEREADVLRLIVNGHNNAEISEKLCVSIHTAKAHVCNILHKLRVEDRTQAAIMALKKRII